MKVSCPACSAKYSIADEKVTGRLAKIRCRKCGTTIVIDGKVEPPNVYAAEADSVAAPTPSTSGPENPAPDGYSVDLGGGDPRTMSVVEIVAAYNASEITAETFVWADGFTDWKPLGEVPELVNALQSAASGPDAGGPVAPAAESPKAATWDNSPAVAAPVAEPARAASKPKAGRTGAADLFGGYAQAGSEEDVTTSAPQGSLGGGAANAAADPQGLTGARNESSVLFSLSALTASSPSNPPPPLTSVAPQDDSGLIDLKALTTATGDPSVSMAPLGMSPLGMAPLGGAPLGGSPLSNSPLGGAPLGMGSPLGGGMHSAVSGLVDIQPQPKSKTGLYIALVAAAAIIGGAIIYTGSQQPQPVVQPTVPTAEPAKVPEPVKTAEPPPAETAKPPSTGVTEGDAAPDAGAKVAPKPPVYHGPIQRKNPTTATDKPKPETGGGDTTEKPKPKKPSTCNCPANDFECELRCRAK